MQIAEIAFIDRIVHQNEWKMLLEIGKKLGFKATEVDVLLSEECPKKDYIPPEQPARRFNQMYEIIRMTLADGRINDQEMKLARKFALRSGFRKEEVTSLLILIIKGIKDCKTSGELFQEYKKATNG